MIVVGGGREYSCRFSASHAKSATVSGLSAAHTVYLNGGTVLLLDKNSEFLSPVVTFSVLTSLWISLAATLLRRPRVSTEP